MVKTVTAFAEANRITEISEIVVDVGELSLVIPKYVEDIYPHVVEDTFLKDTKLVLNVIPGMAECDECNEVFNVIEHKGYCPHCGSRRFETHDAYSKRCADCGFTFYPNAAAATVAIILNAAGELLCVRRSREPAKGTLDLPGGFVDPGESITEGLRREVLEEVGAEIDSAEFLFSFPNTYPFSGHTVHTADAFFRCRISHPETVSAHDDAAEVCWLPLHTVNPADFGLHSVRRGVEKMLALAGIRPTT